MASVNALWLAALAQHGIPSADHTRTPRAYLVAAQTSFAAFRHKNSTGTATCHELVPTAQDLVETQEVWAVLAGLLFPPAALLVFAAGHAATVSVRVHDAYDDVEKTFAVLRKVVDRLPVEPAGGEGGVDASAVKDPAVITTAVTTTPPATPTSSPDLAATFSAMIAFCVATHTATAKSHRRLRDFAKALCHDSDSLRSAQETVLARLQELESDGAAQDGDGDGDDKGGDDKDGGGDGVDIWDLL